MRKLSKITALVGSLLLAAMYFNTASAEANPFAQQADQVQTFDGEDSKCGDMKKDKKAKKDGKCGESKCGDDKMKGKMKDKKMEMKEGKCGDKKKEMKEGKCGDKKKEMKEGKCGGK